MNGPDGWVELGHIAEDGLTFTPAPTVTVELADWIAPLAGGTVLTGGVIQNGMVRFDRPHGVFWLSAAVLGLEEQP